MSRLLKLVLLFACLILPSGLPVQGAPLVPGGAQATETPRDLYGDPLPPGALARLGTARLCQPRGIVPPAMLRVAFSPDGAILASVGGDEVCRLWKVATGEELRRFQGAADFWSSSLAFTPDGKTLYTSRVDGVYSWDVTTGKQLRRFTSVNASVSNVVLSPDGKVLAHESGGGFLVLREAATGTELRRWEGGTPQCFSTDGKVLLTTHGGLWDVATGEALHPITWPKEVGPVDCAALAPDRKTLATGHHSLIRLWDLKTGGQLRQCQGHSDGIRSVAFSPTARSWPRGARTARYVSGTSPPGRASAASTAAGVRCISSVFRPTARYWLPWTRPGTSSSGTRPRAS